jgi:CRISPR-associated protein Cas2
MAVDPAHWTVLRQNPVDEIDPGKDSLRFYFLGANWKRSVEHVGAKETFDQVGPLLI